MLTPQALWAVHDPYAWTEEEFLSIFFFFNFAKIMYFLGWYMYMLQDFAKLII